MKKIFLVMVFLIFGTVSMANKIAYVMVPEKYEDLYVIGMSKEDENTFKKYRKERFFKEEDAGLIEKSLNEKAIQDGEIFIIEKGYYSGTKLLKLETNNSNETKIIVGYKHPVTSTVDDTEIIKDTYVILGSELASEETTYGTLKINYKNDSIPKQQIINFGSYVYSDFPGHIVKENVIIVGTKVGDKRSKEEIEDNREEYDVPKNIVEKFYLLPTVSGQDVYMYAGISPNNSSDEFKVTDALDNVLISMKKEYGTNYINLGDESYGLKNNNEELNTNDRIEAKEDGVYLNDDLIAIGKAPFKVTIRIKNQLTTSNKSSVVKIDNVEIPFSGDTKNYNLSNVEKFEIIYSGNGNGFDFKMKEGENTDVDTGSGAIEEKPPVYIVEGEGILNDGNVIMTSGNNNLRKRESQIEIDVLEGKGIEIKNIKE